MEYIELKEQIKEKLTTPQEFDGNRNLLELGLSSLKIMRMVNQWRKQGIRVSFGELMEEPILDSWWKIIQKSGKKNIHKAAAKEMGKKRFVETNKPFPLTDVQYAYKIGRADGEELGGVGCHAYLEFDGEGVSAEKLEKAWNAVQKHHPMLRARFLENGQQEIMDVPYKDNIEVKDLRDCQDFENYLEETRKELSHRKLRVEAGQVAGITLSLLPNGKTRIHFDLDLLVADVQSLQIILKDLASAYEGKKLPEESKNWSFADYLEEQQKEDGEDKEKARNYWGRRIEDFPYGPELPLVKLPSEVNKTVFTRRIVRIGREEWERLKERAAKCQATPAMLLLSTYAMVLERWSKTKRFLINIPFFNRKTEYEGLEKAVADFTTLLLLEVDLRQRQTFREILMSVQEQMHRDMKYTMYSGVQVQRDISKRDGGNRNVAPVVFACNLGNPLADEEFEKTLGKFSYMISQTPGVWLDFQVYESGQGLMLTWDTVDELFPEGMIHDMLHSLEETLHRLGEETWDQFFDILPENQISFIEEQKRIHPPLNPMRLFDAFLKNAGKTPDKTAIIDTGTNVKKTYMEVKQQALSVAAFLNSAKVEGKAVAISLTRGCCQAVAALGILLSGNEYVPVSLKQPDERRKLIHEKAGVDYVITDRESYSSVSWPESVKIWMIEDMLLMEPLKKLPEITVDSPAYTIMTSGTTGLPKGAEMRHSGAWNTINDVNSRWNVTAEDVLLGVSAMDFDLSVYDLFGMLGCGGTLVMIPEDRSRDADFWLNQILKYHITVWNSVPVLLDMLLIQAEYHSVRLPLKLVLLSGDWIGMELPERVEKAAPGCRFIAMGGATEASIWSNYKEVTLPLPGHWKSIPYGRPLSGQAYRVVDEKGMDAPYWAEGELWIGGAGVGTYRGDHKLVEQKFVSDDSGVWYRTGDKGRFWSDGTIEFLGRNDFQVKIRGHRIELGEIETALKSIEYVRYAVVEPFSNTAGDRYLTAFLECDGDGKSEPLFHKNTEISERINKIWEALLDRNNKMPERGSDFMETLTYGERRTCEIMMETLRLLGVFVQNRNYRYEEIVSAGKIADVQKGTIRQWLSTLVLYGYLEEKEGELVHKSDVCCAVTENTRIIRGIDSYLNRLQPHLPALLQGKEKPADTYYVNNENLTPNDLLDQLPGTEDVVFALINKIRTIAALSKEKCVRILEFGTRDMKVSKMILDELQGTDVEYTYADASLFFLEKAKALTEKYPFVLSQVLDIGADIQKADKQYDCIIAVNTFHRMYQKGRAIQNAANLLSADGVLLVLELTVQTCLQDITATVLEQNPDIKGQSRILDAGHWETLLKENGFDKVAVEPAGGNMSGRNLFVAMSSVGAYGIDVEYVRSKIEDKLPEYMIPNVFYVLDNLPLSKNGKIDRKKLHVFENHQEQKIEKVEAMTETERELCVIWKEIFQKDKIGTQDNYYLLGGDSLIATRMLARIKDKFKIPFTIRDLMGNKTVKEQAVCVERDLRDGKKLETHVQTQIVPDKQHENEPFSLTEVQQAYWIGRSGMYNLGSVSTHCYFELDAEKIDVQRLQTAWNELIRRHGMMRAIIHSDGKQQILQKVPEYQIAVAHLEECNTEEAEKKLVDIRNEMSHQVIAAESWPLYEVRFTALPEDKSRIHISFDNLIFDGWSMFHLLSELANRYRGEAGESEKLELSFRDYVLALEKCKEFGAYERDREYWENRIDEFVMAPELPLAKREEEIAEQKFNRRESYLTLEQWDSLKQSAKNYGITPAVLLMTAYAETLRRWSSSADFTLNLTQFNRKELHPQVNQLVGDFTTLTLLEIKNSREKTFFERAKNLQEQLMKDLEHSFYSAVDLERELKKKTGNTKGSIMPVVFTSGLGIDQWNEGKWLGKLVYNVSQTPQVWLDHQVVERDGGLCLFWDSVDELFYPGMLDEMFEAYIHLLNRLAAEPSLFCVESSSLIEVKISEIRRAANETKTEFLSETLDEMFLNAAERNPDKEAVVAFNRRLTYKEIKQEALFVARYLKDKGVQRGELVAVVMEKGWEQIVAVYGVLFAGAAYLPVDFHNPQERMQKILDDSKTKLVLLQEKVLEEQEWLNKYDCLVVNGSKSVDNMYPVKNAPEDLAYVIYTSGSTGMPKGVMIPHKGAVNTIKDVNRRYNICDKDKVLAISNLHFDLSVYDIFGILGTGGTIVLPDYRKVKDPVHWIQLMNEENITVWNSVPAFMEMLAEYEEYQKKLESEALRLVLMSGDWIPVTLPERLRNLFGDLDIVAMGGATEASIWSNVFDVPNPVPDAWKSIPYGKPLANQKYYILDENLNDCPDWVPGMLYIGGVGLAEGYLNDKEKTEEKYINHAAKKERLYCTGDMGRYWANGNIEFLGRQDQQIKVNGYRIEFGEIEGILNECEGISASHVINIKDKENNKIVAFYCANVEVDEERILLYLKKNLPTYMIPNRVKKVESFPYNRNGKIDTEKLKEWEQKEVSQKKTVKKERTLSNEEKKMSAIWRKVLENLNIGIDDDFFISGGDSLRAIRLVNAVNKAFNVHITIYNLFEYTTISKLVEFVLINDSYIEKKEDGTEEGVL